MPSMFNGGERTPLLHTASPHSRGSNLVVLSVGLALGIEDTRPVLRLEIGLVVNIDLNLNNLSLGLDGVGGDSDGVEEATEELSKAGRAPADNLSGLEVELGSEDGVRDGSLLDLSEGEGLSDGGALVAEGVDASLGVDGDADGEAAGNTRGGGSRGGKVIGGDAGDELDGRSSLLGVEGGGDLWN